MGAQILNAATMNPAQTKSLSARAPCANTWSAQAGVLVVTPATRRHYPRRPPGRYQRRAAGRPVATGNPARPAHHGLCRGAFQAGCRCVGGARVPTTPPTNSTAEQGIPIDDRERAEIITDFVASHLDARWLHQRCARTEMRLSPAVVPLSVDPARPGRQQTHCVARSSEPLTCKPPHLPGARHARCVLLPSRGCGSSGPRQGIELPEGLEILDPDRSASAT